MSKEDFDKARQATRLFLQKTDCINHMFHGPASDKYWLSPLKVLAVNEESYGYQGRVEVDLKTLLDWMNDAGKTKTRTVRYTFSFIQTLLDAYLEGIVPSKAYLQSAYSKIDQLENLARSVVYYNIHSISNDSKRQDTAGIIASGQSKISEFIYKEMVALEPDVIIIGGEPSLKAFNAMWRIDPPLHFHEGQWYSKNIFIQSIKHPSRPDYEEYSSAITKIVQSLKKKR